MGNYGAYQEDARKVVDELRASGRLDEVMSRKDVRVPMNQGGAIDMEAKALELDVQYKAGHSYHEKYNKSDMYCPHCGKQGVWQEDSAGDYYVGERWLCVACEHSWTIQGPWDASDGHEDRQRFDAIKLQAVP